MALIDASQVFSGIDVSSTVGVISAMGAIMMTVGFARWAMYEIAFLFEVADETLSWYRYGDMDHDGQWHERFGGVNSALNKVGLGR